MSGALAERVFAEKLERAGFVDVWMGGHQPFAIDDAARYPLFTPDVIETWIEYKRKNEVDAVRLRPHPWEFALYFDI